MKNWFAAFSLSALCLMAWGQEGALPGEPSADAARSRIATQRQQHLQALDKEDSACLSRFAVTACRNDVAKRRRAVLADLRRQELVLNEAARKEAGREQLEQLKVKAAENAARQAERAATPPVQIRQPAQPEKVRNPLLPKPTQERVDQKAKAVEVIDPAVLAEARRAYDAKQEALIRRRQERDKRLQKPSKPGLPTPP